MMLWASAQLACPLSQHWLYLIYCDGDLSNINSFMQNFFLSMQIYTPKYFLKQVLSQIKEIEENIARLKKAIADKEAPMKVAHTRLETRTERPNVELCRDPVQYRLIEEVGELENSLAQLQQRLGDTQSSLKGLIRNQLALEEDIDVKMNTLFIDEIQCMGMRKSINIQQFWAEIFYLIFTCHGKDNWDLS